MLSILYLVTTMLLYSPINPAVVIGKIPGVFFSSRDGIRMAPVVWQRNHKRFAGCSDRIEIGLIKASESREAEDLFY